MNGNKHSPTPWEIQDGGDGLLVVDVNDEQVFDHDWWDENVPTSLHSLKRFVACVNALEGYDPKAVKELVEVIRQVSRVSTLRLSGELIAAARTALANLEEGR